MSLQLFNAQSTPLILDMIDAEVIYYPNFFSIDSSDYFFSKLSTSISWRQDSIKVFGKTYLQPRETALYGNSNKSYSYSGITMNPIPFTKELSEIKAQVENTCNVNFTSCLLNLYRDGQDSNGWHADNEKELGKHPIIASVSFGEERWFHFKHRYDKTLKQKIRLQHGSMLIMKGKTQEYWLHQIPKTKKIIKPRINLTFRIIRSN